MKSIQTETGVLSVELGAGWLSNDEALSVGEGDIVKVNTFAGDPLTMLFNGYFLASCEMVILGDIWGARIVSFIEPPKRHRMPQIQGTLTEILPIAVRMGEIRISLEELQSLGKGSIVSLGRKYSESADAELYIAGIPSAAGKVVVLYEDFGIRITEAAPAENKLKRLRSTGNLLDNGFNPRFCKDYNFKRPDRFTRIAISKISDVHENLLRTLKNRTPEVKSFELLYVDQLAFEECFEMLEQSEAAYLVTADRHYRRQTGGAGFEECRVRPRLIEEKNTGMPIPPSVREYFEQFFDGNDSGTQNWMFVCGIGNSARELLNDHLVTMLNASWRNIADYNFSGIGLEQKLAGIRKISDKEMIVIVHLGLFDGDKKTAPGSIGNEGVYFIYPYLTLEPIIGLLNL